MSERHRREVSIEYDGPKHLVQRVAASLLGQGPATVEKKDYRDGAALRLRLHDEAWRSTVRLV